MANEGRIGAASDSGGAVGLTHPVPDRSLADAYLQLRPSAYGTFLLALCIMVGVVEGYDAQAMALAAPLLARDWALSSQAVGALLSTSLVGQVIGGFLLAPLGDRFGRRTVLLTGVFMTGGATLSGAYMPDYHSMMASRFIAGLGLGCAIANLFTLSMELVPNRWRSMAVVLVSVGAPFGAAVGAVVVGTLLPNHGVAVVFHVGGISTLVAFLLCVLLLPESPAILVRQTGDQARLRALFGRLGVTIDPAVRVIGHAAEAGRSRVAALFTMERRTTTLLLWLVLFSNLSLVFFFLMWLPSLFVDAGLQPANAMHAAALFSFSGVIGGLILATLLPRTGPILTLGVCYVLMILTIGAFATVPTTSVGFYILLCCCGFLIGGSQFCLNAVVNLFYPASIRTTAVGFALGVGRIGGILAPLAGGFILAHVSSAQQAFYIGLVPAAISLVALVSLRSLKLVGLEAE